MAVGAVVGLIFGAITAVLAQKKGRNPIGWFIFGFFIPIIALIVILVIGPADGAGRAPSRRGARRRRDDEDDYDDYDRGSRRASSSRPSRPGYGSPGGRRPPPLRGGGRDSRRPRY